ncbi:RICIN domain-containing protein [Candidatus Saccharibacteria bacterium]|nr:RICIN domain-containing protein [Candidatus Saccharibacteria bacterium]
MSKHHRIDRRYCLLGALAFIAAATLGFLTFKNSEQTSAINAAYAGFDAGNIISDYVMSEYNSMSESAIQSFLKSKVKCDQYPDAYHVSYNKVDYFSEKLPISHHLVNGHYVCMADENFNGESAAHIIYRAAQDYKINPKVLIVLLEKEQGLVTDSFPNSLQYRSATGYGCPDTAACDSEYYGFKNQVRNAAYFFRYILDHGSRYYPVGNNRIKYNPSDSCGSSMVYVQNRATSALYQYTPYQPNSATLNSNPGTVVSCGAYGNSNFYYYFTRWFGDTRKTVSSVYFNNDSTFTIQASSGKYLVPEGNTSGSKLILSSSATEADRKYQLARNGNFYVIKHVASGLVLDVVEAKTDDGTNIQLFQANGTCAQNWLVATNGNGYSLRSGCSLYKAIDASASTVNTEGAKTYINEYTNSATERWAFNDLAAAVLENGDYVLETTGGKAMDIQYGSRSNGTRMHTYNITFGDNQMFNIARGVDGLYTIKNIASGRVLDVADASYSNGAAVQLFDANGTCAQKWIAKKVGSGISFISSCSNKALDIPNGYVNRAEQKLQIWDANGTNAQVWIHKTPNAFAEGNYIINSGLGGNLVVDIAGGAEKSTNGTNIQIYVSNNTNAQKYKITYNPTVRAYSIFNTTANRMLDVSGAKGIVGANIQTWSSNSTCAQFWRLRPRGNNTYNMFSLCSDKALDVDNGTAKNGANIQLWSFNDTKAQTWSFTKI